MTASGSGTMEAGIAPASAQEHGGEKNLVLSDDYFDEVRRDVREGRSLRLTPLYEQREYYKYDYAHMPDSTEWLTFRVNWYLLLTPTGANPTEALGPVINALRIAHSKLKSRGYPDELDDLLCSDHLPTIVNDVLGRCVAYAYYFLKMFDVQYLCMSADIIPSCACALDLKDM